MAEFDANLLEAGIYTVPDEIHGGYWDVSGSTSGVIIDSTPPTIENMVPLLGVLQSDDYVEFDVIDPSPGVSRVFLFIQYPSGEDLYVIHDGLEFKSQFVLSERTPITNGFHYQIRPTAGWVSGFTLSVHAFDFDGNVA